MRHADSGHDYLNMRDHDRPLNARGQSEAPRMADALSERDWLPQLILVSSATRTLETLEGMSPYMDGARLDLRPEIYRADVSTLLIQLEGILGEGCLLYTSPSPRDATLSRMPSSA